MKTKVITVIVLAFMLINVTSCKQKIINENYEIPLSDIEGAEQEINQSERETPREHFPVEDYIYELEKVVDPAIDPKAKLLYDAHEGGTVVVDHNNHYSIINYDVSAADYTDTTYKPDIYSEGSRAALEHWESTQNLSKNITFRGTPTGRTVQRVGYGYIDGDSINASGGGTYVEFLVTEAYYGTVRPGDYVWVRDSFAIGYKDGKMQLVDSNYCHGYIFLGMDYLVSGENIQKNYYEPFPFKALRLDVEYKPTSDQNEGMDYPRYKKYIVDKDIKLCKEQEYERFSILNYNLYRDETFMKHQENPDFTYSDPQFAPTDEQKKIVDEQILYYSEREERWKEDENKKDNW